ncbi:MAG: hypothetical protein JOZ96_29890 [Acidobacteria bacterium]|nr:hypothetical protein [Acidobacteriota bacterium]
MRGLTTRLLSAVLTFVVGVALTSLVPVRTVEPLPASVEDAPRSRPCAEAPAWCVLLSFEDRDLDALDRESYVRLRQAIDALTEKPNPVGNSYDTKLITQLSNARGQYRYVLVEELPLLSIPGESRLRVHVFDGQGRVLSASDFTCGYRIDVTGVKRSRMPEFEVGVQESDVDVLEVGSRRVYGGPDVARQFYALLGDAVVLVRLEDGSGTPVANTFSVPGHTIGPGLPARTASEWERTLASSDPAEALSALMWVGGEHMDVKRPLLWPGAEELKEARLADEVRSRPVTRELIRLRANCDNRWIRDAAQLAERAGASVEREGRRLR